MEEDQASKSETPSFSHIKIKQFPPTGKDDELGAYGWGFDEGGFRIVVYGPSEADTEEVKQAAKDLAKNDYARRSKKRSEFAEYSDDNSDAIRAARNKNRKELNEPAIEKPEKQTHHADHPPAHVHMIQLKAEQTTVPRLRGNAGKRIYDTIHKENRYELIEREDGSYRTLLIAPHIKEDGSMSKRAKEHFRVMIDEKNEPKIQKILDVMAPQLVECWRKLYSPASYTAEQIAINPTLALGYDGYVSQEIPIETPKGTRSFIRRQEGPDNVSYTGNDMRLRVVFPPEDDNERSL